MGVKTFFSGLFKSKRVGVDDISAPPIFAPPISNGPALRTSLISSRRTFSQAAYSFTGAKWLGGLSSSGVSPLIDNLEVRQNARAAYHESTHARAIVDRFADTVVDTGLQLESTPKTDILGITLEEGEVIARDLEERFDSWARDRKSTLSETMNFYQAQRLAEVFQQRENDYFVRLFYSKRRDLQNPLQIDFVDPNQIANGVSFTPTTVAIMQRDGIERDQYGREIAYWVTSRDPEKGSMVESRVPALSTSGRRLMLHGYQPEYAGQGRGFSKLAHALQEFENLTDFTAAQIKKAINQSNITMYVKPSQTDPASNPLESIAKRQPAGPASQMFGGSTGDTTTTDDEDLVDFYPVPEATMRAPGSVGVFGLHKGEDLRSFDNTAPAETFDRFVDAFCAHLCASVSMPLEVLLMKFSQNYSASRGALILFWRVAQIYRAELVSDFLNPVYEEWLTGEIAAGRVSLPGWNDPRLRAAWLCNNWVGSPMPNVDPQKTAAADAQYAVLGAHTLDRIARNLNGSSGKANRAKLAREFAELPDAPWAAATGFNDSGRSSSGGDNKGGSND